MLEVKEVQTLSEQEKTVSLFEFIKELEITHGILPFPIFLFFQSTSMFPIEIG